MFLFALMVSSLANAQSVPLTGRSLGVNVDFVVPESCEGFTTGLRYGYQFEKPFDLERPELGGLLARPTLAVNTLPCQGYGVAVGSKLGVRGGPVQMGLDVQFGPTMGTEYGLYAYGNTSLDLFVDVGIGPVEVGVNAGAMAGYLDEKWVKLGGHVAIRF